MILLSSAALLFSFEKAYSSGFFLIEQSVSAMGAAYAGGAAYNEDSSTIWFNPAGMIHICGNEIVAGGHTVIPIVDYNDRGSIAIDGFTGLIAAGGVPNSIQMLGAAVGSDDPDGRDGGETAFVPQAYFSSQINRCLWVGLGVTSPYGLVTDYKDGWRGRYHAIRSAVTTVNINPSFAWKINNCFSVGAGFDAMYLHAKLTNAVDFGLIGVANLGTTAAHNNDLYPQKADGKVELKGNSWGYGGNVGILWEPCNTTRFGVHYRSEVKHHVKGREKFKDIPPGIETTPLSAVFVNTGAKAALTLPMQLSVSGYHELTKCCSVMADITWTKWSSLKELRFKFNNPLQPDGVTTLKWKSSLRYSLGLRYCPTNCLVTRFGVALDETPIPNKKYRTPRIPGQDRFWTTLGFGYWFNQCTRLDVAYAHLFVKHPKLDSASDLLTTQENWFKGGLSGVYDAYTDIISAQIVYKF